MHYYITVHEVKASLSLGHYLYIWEGHQELRCDQSMLQGNTTIQIIALKKQPEKIGVWPMHMFTYSIKSLCILFCIWIPEGGKKKKKGKLSKALPVFDKKVPVKQYLIM